MKFIKEESFLVDYLKTFDLIISSDDLKKNNSFLDKISDLNYKKQIEKYIMDLLNNDTKIINYFVGGGYNLLYSIVTYYGITSFTKYIEYVKKIDMQELSEILSYSFQLKKQFNFIDIDELNLSFQDKWKLAIITKEFMNFKEKLILELQTNYIVYEKYADKIYGEYNQKITMLENDLSDKHFIYTNIFSKFLDEDIFYQLDRKLVLLLSANEIIVYSSPKYSHLAVGLYVLDVYLEEERQKKLDEVKLTQIFKALSDPTRYGIIKNINKGITSNSVLSSMFSISRAAISMQFKYLQENDIIYVDETTKKYVVNKDIIKHAIEVLQIDVSLFDE